MSDGMPENPDPVVVPFEVCFLRCVGVAELIFVILLSRKRGYRFHFQIQ